MPRTAYLLTEWGTVRGEFDSLFEIGLHLGVVINNDGEIDFMGKRAHPTYGLLPKYSDGFTKEHAKRDWCAHHMKNYLPSRFQIYRYLLE